MAMMVWTERHDIMLCREVLSLNRFQFKKSSVQRGNIWFKVAENLASIRELHCKVDRRAVRDRYKLLSDKLRKKLRDEAKASGIATEMTEVEVALEDFIEREDAAEAQMKENREATKQKKADDREGAEEMRTKAMEKLGDTQKRKMEEGDEQGSKKKGRSSGGEALRLVREKNEIIAALRREEMELKVKAEEAASKRHDQFMLMICQQQQQHQDQINGMQAMMLQQQQQHTQFLSALLSKDSAK